MSLRINSYTEMTAEHLGPDATDADVAKFIDLCEQVSQAHPAMSDLEVLDAVWGDGDYFKNARRLGAIIRDDAE